MGSPTGGSDGAGGPGSVIPFDQLPDGFAESVTHPADAPAVAHPAATIVLLRDGDGGPQLLLLRRTRRTAFAPGAYVFPGGRVDASDADPELVARLDGLDARKAARRLDLPDADPRAPAYYLAAIREAFEETGILVAHDAGGDPPRTAAECDEVARLRRDLLEERIGFVEVLDRLGCRLDGSAMEYFAHWITPEAEPRRYDTRFFAAKVRSGAHALVDEREMTEALWLTPGEALLRWRRGALPMVFPTIRTLEALTAFASVDAILAEARSRRVAAILPRLVMTPNGIGLEIAP